MKNKLIGTALIAIMLNATSYAETVFINSGKEKNQLIELYTSEGCSSCPPADGWISNLKSDPRLWNDIIPIAFHVDYWDRLGWKDELANKNYSQRQRQYHQEGGISQVYTPGFVVAGEEWRGFFKRNDIKTIAPQETGELTAEVIGEDISIQFIPAVETTDTLIIHVAILGFEIANEIKAGENKGKTLTHDFAVLGHEAKQIQSQQDKFSLSINLPQTQIQAEQRAVVVWVSGLDSQSPIQVAGNWL